MSSGRAIKQREEMIQTYKAMLEFETYPERIEDIKNQILLAKDEIGQIKQGKPLFGKPKTLVQNTTIIEPSNEKGQIISSVHPLKEESPQSKSDDDKKIGNRLRTALSKKAADTSEDSLKAKIAAAKAAKTNKKGLR